MSRIYADPQRVADATQRVLDAIKYVSVAVVPSCAAICATPGMVFGVPGVIIGAIAGTLSGLRLSLVVASALETKMITIVQMDELLNRQTINSQQATLKNPS